MAVTVAFHEFAKKPNSTAQPVESGTRLDCEFKQPFDLLAPTIILIADDFTPTGWNYAHIPVLNRYYYVADWSYVQGRWFASTRVDALASWRSDIGALNQYVLRSSAEFDGAVTDSLYPLKAENVLTSVDATGAHFTSVLNNGTFVIGVVNGAAAGVGSVNYYAMTAAQLREFITFLLSDANYLDISSDELSASLSKALVNPLDYVASVRWFPFAISGTDVQSIKFGWWDWTKTSTVAGILTNYIRVPVSDGIDIPRHPQAADRGGYLNFAPFSRYELHVAPFGTIPIDSARIQGASRILYTIPVDITSGEGTLIVYSDRDVIHTSCIARVSAQVAIPIQISSLYRGYSGGIVGTFGDMMGKAAVDIGAWVMQQASNMFNLGQEGANATGVISALGADASISTVGGGGSFAALHDAVPALNAMFTLVVDDANEHMGRPLCAYRTISDVPGFLQIASPDPEIPATQPEITEIRTAMVNGFFYE